jgi:hypothetical protein
MFAGEGACSRGKLWREQCASILNHVSIISIADEKQSPVLPMRFGMKRKIFSSGGDDRGTDLSAVPLMPLTLTELLTPLDCRLVFIAIVFDSRGLGFVRSNALGVDPSI